MARYIIAICLSLLIGTGLQYLAVGIAEGTLDFYKFNGLQWCFQIIWWVFLIAFAIFLCEDE